MDDNIVIGIEATLTFFTGLLGTYYFYRLNRAFKKRNKLNQEYE